MEVDFREIWTQLLCLVPVYAADGTNGTEIRLSGSKTIYSRFRTRTVVSRLARLFMVDLEASRRHYAEICGCKYLVPIPLRPDLILVPVFARHARVKDDWTRAFVVKEKIAEVIPLHRGLSQGGSRRKTSREKAQGIHKDDTMRSRLVFTDGSHLDVPQRPEGLRDILYRAKLAENEAANLNCRPETPSCIAENLPPGCTYRLCPLLQAAE